MPLTAIFKPKAQKRPISRAEDSTRFIIVGNILQWDTPRNCYAAILDTLTIGRGSMMKDNNRLKLLLVLQSLCPLFVLLLIKYLVPDQCAVSCIVSALAQGALSSCDIIGELLTSVSHNIFALVTCTLWVMLTIVVSIVFRNLQNECFDSHGERVIITREIKDSGAVFLATFILPLLTGDLSSLRDFIFFIAMLAMVVYLLLKSNLFYQNPVLVALGYKTFEFQFISPYDDVSSDVIYVGIARHKVPNTEAMIKRRYIADGVFIVYDD